MSLRNADRVTGTAPEMNAYKGSCEPQSSITFATKMTTIYTAVELFSCDNDLAGDDDANSSWEST
jgi:hypothetical protein